MIDLKAYFHKNYKQGTNPYYDRFYKNYYLENIDKIDFEVLDFNDLKNKWKAFLYPTNEYSKLDEVKFGILSFYLFNNGYIIEEHPNLLSNLESYSSISNGELKSATRSKFGANGSMNGVAWRDRSKYIDELNIVKKYNNEIPLQEDVNTIMESISTRNATFNEMSDDEKLMNIRNVFENIGKKNGKYLDIPFEDLTCGYITKESVTKFANELQCFRHGDEELLKKRSLFSNEQKSFMIDYGKLILNISVKYLNESK